MAGADDGAGVLDSLAAQGDIDSGQPLLAGLQSALANFIQADSAWTYAASVSAGNVAQALTNRAAALAVFQTFAAALT